MRAPRWLLPVAILLLGAAVRLVGIQFGLPHTECRPDESVIVSQALRFFGGDFNPHFFEWPSLYFYVVHALLRVAFAAGWVLGYWRDVGTFVATVTADPTWIHLCLRLISVTCGVLTLLEVSRLASSVRDRATGLVAMFFLAVSLLAVREAHFGILDVPVTWLIVRCVRLLAAAADRPSSWREFLAAGIWAGLATSLKYNAAAVVPVVVVAALLRDGSGRSSRRLISTAGVTATFLCAWLVVAMAGTPYAILDWPAFSAGLARQFARLADGHGVRVANAWHYHAAISLRYGVGLPILLAAFAGIAASFLLLWRRALVLWTFPVLYYLVIGTGHTAFVRYASPLVPFVCIAAAIAVREVFAIRPTIGSWRLNAGTALVAVSLAMPSIRSVVRLDTLLSTPDTRLLAADWLGARIRPGDTVYQSGWMYAHPLLGLREHEPSYVAVDFNSDTEQFVLASGEVRAPEWIVIARSPLRFYTPAPDALRQRISSSYRLVKEFAAAIDREPESWFDRQDAFFLPYARFGLRIAPGPDFSIYQRADHP